MRDLFLFEKTLKNNHRFRVKKFNDARDAEHETSYLSLENSANVNYLQIIDQICW